MTGGKQPSDDRRAEQKEEAQFLAEEFDIKVPDAAALVVEEGEDSDDLAADLNEVEKGRDALKGLPVPKGDPNEVVADSDETALKPVLHRRNESGS